MKNHAAITSFTGGYDFLSNFYEDTAEVNSAIFGIMRTGEHLFQAAKADTEEGYTQFHRIKTPGQAKKAGRAVSLRPDWEEVKIAVMLEVIRAKFRQGTLLAKRLEETDDRHLEEGNRHGDRVWGTVGGVGRNLLGRILMRVRAENRGFAYNDIEIADSGKLVYFYWTRALNED